MVRYQCARVLAGWVRKCNQNGNKKVSHGDRGMFFILVEKREKGQNCETFSEKKDKFRSVDNYFSNKMLESKRKTESLETRAVIGSGQLTS